MRLHLTPTFHQCITEGPHRGQGRNRSLTKRNACPNYHHLTSKTYTLNQLTHLASQVKMTLTVCLEQKVLNKAIICACHKVLTLEKVTQKLAG